MLYVKGKFTSSGLNDRNFEVHGLGSHSKMRASYWSKELIRMTPSSSELRQCRMHHLIAACASLFSGVAACHLYTCWPGDC